jgi:type VI secretion system secreted protein VgrG
MSEEVKRVLSFHSGAVPDDTLFVSGLAGQEEISGLYRYELELFSQKADLDYGKLLAQPATLSMKKLVKLKGQSGQGAQNLKVHGMLSRVEQGEQLKDDRVKYRAVLVPRLWKLSLTTQSRIFLEKTVKEIV